MGDRTSEGMNECMCILCLSVCVCVCVGVCVFVFVFSPSGPKSVVGIEIPQKPEIETDKRQSVGAQGEGFGGLRLMALGLKTSGTQGAKPGALRG